MLPTFVINLERDIPKRIRMEAQLKEYPELHVEFIKGVEGSTLSEAEKAAVSTTHFRTQIQFTPAALGCSLSHISIYRKIEKRSIPYALILEDDAILSKQIDVIKDLVPLLQTDCPIVILLTPCFRYKKQQYQTMGNDIKLCFKVRDAMMTSGYLINNSAATLLVKRLIPVNYLADEWGTFRKMGVNLYGIVPHVISFPNNLGTIGNAFKDKIKRNPLLFLRILAGKCKAKLYLVFYMLTNYEESKKLW